jgi:hypothetical protein
VFPLDAPLDWRCDIDIYSLFEQAEVWKEQFHVLKLVGSENKCFDIFQPLLLFNYKRYYSGFS